MDAIRVPGGWRVTVEIPNRYTRPQLGSTSAFEQVFIPEEWVLGRTAEELREAIKERLTNPFEDIDGATVLDPVPETKAILRQRMDKRYANWLQLRTTREEAQNRSMPAGVITALTNAENDAWTAYAAAVNAWWQA